MAENDKSLSARGSFGIGFALGIGVGLLLFYFQTTRLTQEMSLLRNDIQILTKRSLNIQGELSASKVKAAEK